MCQHGPNGKCPNCLQKQFISDVAHVSFDSYLNEKKLKCKGVHSDEVKCNNCLPPSQIRYKVDLHCKDHAPYPKGMCSKCLPPTISLFRQPYRHVDFVQFMNVNQLGNFVKYWTSTACTKQRFGWIYGYYAADPNYKDGVRAIVQAIYQPPQQGTISDFKLGMDPLSNNVELISNLLGLQKIGWIITETNHDTVLSEKQVRFAAALQEEMGIRHSSGYPVSKFITIVMRQDKTNPAEVKPEVYMISDQGQTLEREGLFVDSGRRKFMKVRESKDPLDLVPTFVANKKETSEFEPQFLVVNVAHGSSGNKFAILKQNQFPVENRDRDPSKADLREYLKKVKRFKGYQKYSDFHFLLYLSRVLDMDTVMHIAEAVQFQRDIGEHIDLIINQYAA